MSNKNLRRAKRNKNNEYYTTMETIIAEIENYDTEIFKGKTVLCNCDDPFESNFFLYFASSIKHFGLKKVIGVAYRDSSIIYTNLELSDIKYIDDTPKNREKSYIAEFTPEMAEEYDIWRDGDVKQHIKEALCNKVGSVKLLNGNGDFRSDECLEILEKSDIVVTNPPFSLFREYIKIMYDYNKKFIVLGNRNSLICKGIFEKIKDGELNIGYTVPKKYTLPDGSETTKLQGLTRWYTNINVNKKVDKIVTYKRYNENEYSRYDNYNAIHISKVSDIPNDYYGLMGVPISYMDKHNEKQFEIVDALNRYAVLDVLGTNEKVHREKLHSCNIGGKAEYVRIIIRKIRTLTDVGERMQLREERIKVRDIAAGYKDSNECGVVAYSGKLNVRPEYQREFVYSGEQRDAVIDTIRNGYPLNVMYWVENEDGTYECLDGQQRTISICQYVHNKYPISERRFENLTQEEKDIILNYEIPVYFCKGSDSEKLAWFRTINKVGERLNEQELRNAIYTGKWLADAKRYFSKSGCPAFELGKKYIKGTPIRQDFLETAIEWIADREGLSIEGYMAKHQHDDNAEELWTYYQDVINWVTSRFTVYRKEMKGLPWGIMYNKYSCDKIVPSVVEAQIAELMIDKDVTKRSGIYMYVLSGEEKWLNIRKFDDADKRAIYEIQKGICPYCEKEGRASIEYDIDDMEVDHIMPWSKGGKTEISNGQCLCKEHNRRKSNI